MYVKKPRGAHRTFKIIDSSSRPFRTVQNSELDAINTEFRAGRLSYEKAHQAAEELADRLTPARIDSWLPENEALADAYWRARIRPKRSNVAPEAAKHRIFWAVRQLGATSILKASVDALYDALSHLSPTQKKRCAFTLNAMMRWKGMDKVLYTERVPESAPEYLTYDEITSISLPRKEWNLCMLTAFATGCRYGELFTIGPLSFREDGTHVLINGQIKKDLKFHATKNQKSGEVYIIPELREAVHEWAQVPQDVKMQMRAKGQPGKQFKLLCAKVAKKDMTFHNLRHSYARFMSTQNEGKWLSPDREGATLEDLRVSLRDSMATVERYYKNWQLSSSMMRSNRRRFGG